MADPDFAIFIDSADDVRKVKLSSKMDVYAVASISGDPRNGNQEAKTPVVKDGGTNPKWVSHPINFTVFEAPLHNQLTLNINLFCDRTLGDTTFGKAKIGEAKIPLKELLDRMGGGNAQKKQIKQFSCGVQPRGTINFRYIFGDKFWVPQPQNNSQDPGTGSPVGYPGSSSWYPPASHAVAYPPAQAYSYPPPGAYAPPPHQQPGYSHAPPPRAGYAYGYAPRPGPGYPMQQVLQGGFLTAGISNDVVQMAAAYTAGGDDAGFGGGYDAGFGGGYDSGFDDAGFGGGYDSGFDDAGFGGGYDAGFGGGYDSGFDDAGFGGETYF